MPNSLNKLTIKNFWRDRAEYAESRWTNNALLEFENLYLKTFLPPQPITILDIGSGSGQLSKSIKREGDKLIAVDQEVRFEKYFVDEDMEFVHRSANDFDFEEHYDLILLFGVINYLTDQEISDFFSRVASMTNQNFQLIVKAQFALENECQINKFSHELNFQYSARYPHFDRFMKLLTIFKKEIEVIDYPIEFQGRANFRHKAIRIHEK